MRYLVRERGSCRENFLSPLLSSHSHDHIANDSPPPLLHARPNGEMHFHGWWRRRKSVVVSRVSLPPPPPRRMLNIVAVVIRGIVQERLRSRMFHQEIPSLSVANWPESGRGCAGSAVSSVMALIGVEVIRNVHASPVTITTNFFRGEFT